MSHLDILLPFGLPPEELATDLFRELNVPALATLIARARFESTAARHEVFDGLFHALPHEIWIARRFGLAGGMQSGGSPPIATAAMREFGLSVTPGTWFIVNPVHFHIARDHLVLTDPAQLRLSDQESRTLYDMAQPLFEEAGKTLLYGNPHTWFTRADDWGRLQTSTPDAASGHNIDIWMPKGEGERNWRKLQNEVQMHWFGHAVNDAREARGLKPANSIWLWGGDTQAGTDHSPPRYTHAFNLGGWMRALEQHVPMHFQATAAADVIGAAPGHGLLMLDALREPALNGDWSQWLARFAEMETAWFAPLRDALKTGAIDRMTLVLTHHARISTFAVNRHSLRKFWVKPSLAPLIP